MPDITSYQVANSLYLVRQRLNKTAPAKPVEVPTNHFVVIDCSYSMSYDLPQIREQLKKKLPKLLKESDTLSIIWFASRGQFGTLLEAEPVATLSDLQDVERAIDRWLKPVGCTGFKEPMEEAGRVVERVTQKHPGSVASLFFMSDGCDNQWNRNDILKATEKAAGGFGSCTFVEYGYYADRPLLTAMAEKSGGSLIFSEDFARYAPLLEAAVQKKLSGAPRVEVKIDADPIGGFAFALADGDLLTYAIEGGVAHVPEDLRELVYLSPQDHGDSAKPLSIISKQYADPDSEVQYGPEVIAAAYAATSLYAVRMKPKVVLPLLKALGDVKLIEQFSTCFGKQAYSAFQDASQGAAFTKQDRWVGGWDPDKVPREDAFTVLQLLRLLAEDEGNRVLLDHEAFKYKRIGRARVDASDLLTTAEQEEIEELTQKIAKTKKAAEIAAHTNRIAEITGNKEEPLSFKADPAPDGYPINTLTFNENRPNVSFLVRKQGTVDVSAHKQDGQNIPDTLPSFIFRNYAAIKDGIVNIDHLPVRLTQETYDKLNEAFKDIPQPMSSVFDRLQEAGYVEAVINLRALPVINQQMVSDVGAQTFFEKKFALNVAQAEAKVYNSFAKELLPAKESESFKVLYGEEETTWLKEHGITDHGGFAPKSVQGDAQDSYMGKELKVSLKGLSSLPSLNAVRKQIDKGKLNLGARLMKPTIDKVEAFLTSDAYTGAADQDAVLKAWLDGNAQAAKATTRGLIYEIAQTTFALVVGQTWFTEFSSLDENSMDIDILDDEKLPCTAEMREIEVKI